ncbi:hypothetical protein Sjap_024039 [Stephania japonica]|uniref:Uncharacterized protein n=1 Tax=Stephania japonica TaxID=461633 RepID=A0AAP0EFW8_9MAGN
MGNPLPLFLTCSLCSCETEEQYQRNAGSWGDLDWLRTQFSRGCRRRRESSFPAGIRPDGEGIPHQLAPTGREMGDFHPRPTGRVIFLFPTHPMGIPYPALWEFSTKNLEYSS